MVTVCVAALAPPASAGTLSAVVQDDRNPGQLLEYVGGAGESNRLTVELTLELALVTDPAGVTPGPGCSAVPGQPSQVMCARQGYYRYLEVDLGDGDDEIVALPPGLSSTVEGGSGNDLLRGVPSTRGGVDGQFFGEVLDGGPGEDVLISGPAGGQLTGGTGEDRIQGRGGRDLLLESPDDGSADRLEGGRGRDLLSYRRRAAGMHVTLAAGDGAAGEEDSTTGIEDVEGGRGDDVLTGNAAVNQLLGGRGADRLLGGAGDDSLLGQGGADRLVGGAGADGLLGGDGSDTLAARDSFFDQLACSGGTDRAIVDELDMIYARRGFGVCEQIGRRGTPTALPAGISTPTSFELALLTSARSRRVLTEVACPSDMAATCSGVLHVRYRGRVAATASFVVRPGRSTTLRALATEGFHRTVGGREGVQVTIEVRSQDRTGRLRVVRATARTR